VGRDGEFGGLQALDDKTSLNRVMVQVRGEASVIDPRRLSDLALEHPSIRGALLKYEQYFLAQVQQTAACNAVHSVRQRLARWLIRMHHLVGPDLQLTQEFLAQMMGVRRPTVTDVARELQAAGLIDYKRGHITIVNIRKVHDWACECEDDLKSHHQLLFDDRPV
jgi:CRP-like cAMP-binding protein